MTNQLNSATESTNPNTGWLDEELRRQRATISELQELVDKQQITIADQVQRIVVLEDRLAKTQAGLTHIAEVEESLRYTRDQMSVSLAEIRQERQKSEADFIRNRQAEREQDLRVIQELQGEMLRFEPLEQSLAARQTEDRRLNELIMRATQQIEELVKRDTSREDRFKQVTDHNEQMMVQVAQLEGDLEAANKLRQELQARTLLLETSTSRIEQQINELQTVRAEVNRKQDEMLETQRRNDRDRSQVIAESSRRLEGFAHQLEQWAEQLRYFTDQHERNRRVLRDVQEIAQQVSQQQDQLRQAQRLGEEQLRREFREWRSEWDRRWAQESDRREKASAAQDEIDVALGQRLTELEQFKQDTLNDTNEIIEHIKSLQANFSNELTQVRRAQLLSMKQQAKVFQELVANMHGMLGEEVG
ncbi:MAG: hypothetical protein GXY52_01285 [Chloroflexi bacterium]|nr:hypothetical protein [Chloroflexota bacterium]